MKKAIEFDKSLGGILKAAKIMLKDRYTPKVFGGGNDLFIVSSDGSMIFRFPVENKFIMDFDFSVKDYAPGMLKENNGRLFFERSKKGYTKRTYPKPTGYTVSKVRNFYDSFDLKANETLYLTDIRDLIRRDLNFVYFSISNGTFTITQLDFDGRVALELERDEMFVKKALGDMDMVSVGVSELLFPLSLTEDVTINFPKGDKMGKVCYCWLESADIKMPFVCLLACRCELKTDTKPQSKKGGK